jgi:hypothetical protein
MSEHNFDWESDAQLLNEKLASGKLVYERLIVHDRRTAFHNGESDTLAIDDFFDSLSPTEYDALQVYTAQVNEPSPSDQQPMDVDPDSNSDRKLSHHGDQHEISTETERESHNILNVINRNHKTQMLSMRGIEHTGIPLSQLLDQYIKSKARKTNKTKMDKGLFDTETEIQRLIMFVDNINNQDLTKSLLEERYINRRQSLPNMVHRNPQYISRKEPKIDRLTGKPTLDRNRKPLNRPVYIRIDDIIKLASTNPEAKFNVPRTVNNEFTNIATFLRAMEENGYIEKGLGDYLIKNKLEDEEDTTVIPFNDNELSLLFNNETYHNQLLFDKPHRHWLPLISLYHGNRIGEMAMLYVDDLVQMNVHNADRSENIWVFVIQRNDERKQSRKNKQSARIVPIHHTLIDLGLINYRKQLIDAGEMQLFPKEKPTSGHNWGNNTSNWFNNSHDGNNGHGTGYAVWCGVEKHVIIDGAEKKKVFHSLRKNWSTQAKRLGLDHDIRRELTGHGEGMKLDVHAKDYEGDYELLERKIQLDKVHYDLELTKIKKWV